MIQANILKEAMEKISIYRMDALKLYSFKHPPQNCRICVFSFYLDSHSSNMRCELYDDRPTATYAYREGCESYVFIKRLVEVM